jgi:hypothetical protein
LIHHEDCKYYASLKEKVLGFLKSRWQTVTGPDQEDVALVLKVFRHFLSHLGVSVELYHARFSDSSQRRITFDQMGS